MINVPHIEIKLSIPTDFVAPVYLGPAGNAGFDVVATSLLWRVMLRVFGKQRSRTDQAHVTRKDIPKLRQLIKAKTAKKCAKSSQPFGIGT